MAIIRELSNAESYSTNLSTIALFCGISCTIVMIRFKGFKRSLNLTSSKTDGRHSEVAPQVSLVGAYRTSKEEYFGDINYLEAPKKITPSMVKLPPATQTQIPGNIKSYKSTGDLTKVQNAPAVVRQSTPNVSIQGSREAKKQLKEQKKLEKDRLAEQKKREKLAAQAREREEKLMKEREKQQTKEAKERGKQKKNVAPQPQQKAIPLQKVAPQQKVTNTHQKRVAPQKREAPPPPEFKTVGQLVQPNANPLSQRPVQYSRNSLESSISKSSGPPPYKDISETIFNKVDNNAASTNFIKPTETSSSWDMISEHRKQMTTTKGAAPNSSKQKHMDLGYNFNNIISEDRDNSEA